jgi:hypothetical protein
MLNINQRIEEFVRALEESEDDETKNRMRAAMRIGARMALECCLLESYPGKTDIEKVRKTLDDAHDAGPGVKVALIPPSPTVIVPAAAAAPIVCSRGSCDDPDCEAAERCLATPAPAPAPVSDDGIL